MALGRVTRLSTGNAGTLLPLRRCGRRPTASVAVTCQSETGGSGTAADRDAAPGAGASTSAASRRTALLLPAALLAPVLSLGWSVPAAQASDPAWAAAATSTSSSSSLELFQVAEVAAPASAATAGPSSAPAAAAPSLLAAEAFTDVDFQVYPPAGYKSIEMNPERPLDARGPTPERNPIRSRFDSPDGTAAVSVLVRSAQVLKAMLSQVTDVSQYGSLGEVELLVLPRGSKLITSGVAQVRLPARKTNLGDLEPPPQNYYRYEFITASNLHVVMSVAAQRGRVYVCGGSAAVGPAWDAAAAKLRASVESFRIVTLIVRLRK